jgi:hypothetical protein
VVHVMVENEGPQALIKPEATWTHLQYIFWIIGFKRIVLRIEWTDGYSDQN